MKKKLLNITTIQAGYKIQLIKEIRKKWGENRTQPGRRIVFYEIDGQIIIEPLEDS